MANTRILNAAVVAALFTACTDVPCETKGAVRDHRDVCGCPAGTREIELVVNDDSKSECVSGDAGGVAVDNASEADASRARPAAADGGREMDATTLVDAANAKEAGEGTDAAALTSADAGDALILGDTGSPETPLVPQAPACIPAPEACDGKDNDCDGVVDQGVKTRCWADADGDGYAAAGAALVESCDACGAKQTAQEPVTGKTDCDDADAKKSPGATDICGDKVDNDCDGKPDDDDNNACGGACSVQLPGKPGDACNNGQQGACARPGTYECRADHSMTCNAPMVPAATAEVCGNGKDDDCKNGVDDGCVMNLCGGWSPLTPPVGGSCMVKKGTCSYPGKYACAQGSTDATICGGAPPAEDCSTPVDDNCNGIVNGASEGCCTPHAWYPDCDGDGFATNQPSAPSCSPPAASPCPRPLPSRVDPAASRWLSVAPVRADCEDADADYWPGQTAFVQPLSGRDPNCDGESERQRAGDKIVVVDEAANQTVLLCRNAADCPCFAAVSGSEPDLSNRGFLCDGGYYAVSLLDASCVPTSTTKLVSQWCR